MPQSRRWVPTYAIYLLEHEGEVGLSLMPGSDPEGEHMKAAFRQNRGHWLDDSKIVERFVSLSHPDATLSHLQ